MTGQMTFQYQGYHPLTNFESLTDYEALTALIVLLSKLEAEIPGTIKHLLSVVSLVDGGFSFKSTVGKESSELAMSVQQDFLEVILEKVQELRDQPNL